MRAALLTEPGRPPTPGERDLPSAGEGAVLVRVTAAPITPLDLLCASGTSYFGRPATPYVPGVQGVGVLEADAGDLPAGSMVWFPTAAGMAPGDGSMAQWAAVPAGSLVPVPDGVDPVPAAALGLSAVAAWMALTWRGGLAAGETVLVLGAGGVVGQAAVQLARSAGAGRVVALARTAAACDRAAGLGADATVALGDGAEPVPALAARLAEAAGGPVDLVLDPLYGVPAAAAARTLRPHGRLVNLGSSAGETSPLDSSTLRSRSLQVLGYTNNELTAEQRAQALGVVFEQLRRGELQVRHRAVPLEQVEDAWADQAGAAVDGRIVLTPHD